MAMIEDLAEVLSPQNQTTHFFAVVAYTPGKATTLIPERRGYLKSVVPAKHRLSPKFGAEAKVTEQGR